MENSKKGLAALGLIFVLFWSFSALYGEEAAKALKGKVYYLDKPNLSLVKRFEWAQKEFQSLRKGEYYLAGYSFESRKEVNIHGDCTKLTDSYRVKLKEGEIVISRKGEIGKHFSTDEGTEPVGILFLHKISRKSTLIIDADIIDFDNTYEFKETPLFWLGNVDSDESVSFLKDMMEDRNHELQKKVVFVCSLHNSPKVYDFLKGVALGNFSHKVTLRNFLFSFLSHFTSASCSIRSIVIITFATPFTAFTKPTLFFSASILNQSEFVNFIISFTMSF